MKILAGKYKRRSLKLFSNASVRPTCGLVKEAVFNICNIHIENAHFLDLFAGVGSMGFEALSRGAATVTFVDSSQQSIRLIRANADLLDKNLPILIIKSDARLAILKMVKKQVAPFDIIYIDPPYSLDKTYILKVLEEIVQGNILADHGVLFLENALSQDFIVQGLEIIKKRKFGDTFLTQYHKVLDTDNVCNPVVD